MYKAIKRNKLKPFHKNLRIKLASKYLGNQKDFIFCDEKKFQSSSNSNTLYITRPINSNPYDEKYIDYCNTSSISAASDVNIYCWIGPFGKGN